jgi:hypothetical protein
VVKRLTRLSTVVALVAGVAVFGPAAPALAAYSDPLTGIATSGFGLTYVATAPAALDALDAALPNVGVTQVLASANHPMGSCDSNEVASLPISPTPTRAMCWDDGDATTAAWNPQGITSSGDADDDGAWGVNRLILSGWNYTGDDRRNDARVAFIDYNDPANPKYRWVYLVDPNDTGSNFTAAKAHVGGMVWYGDKLLVSAVGNTGVAIRVFDMGRILQMTDGSATIGRTSSGWAAYGYQYVLPEIGRYQYTAGTCTMANNTGTPCFSSISLDRSTSPDSLVAAEYFDDGTGSRLFRYSFGADYLLSAASSGAVSATAAYRSGVANAQGVLSWNGRWYVAHSSSTNNGQLWRLTPGATGVSKTCTNSGTSSTMCWALHPEALTHWYSDGLVWSVSEAPNQRMIFAVPLADLP